LNRRFKQAKENQFEVEMDDFKQKPVVIKDKNNQFESKIQTKGKKVRDSNHLKSLISSKRQIVLLSKITTSLNRRFKPKERRKKVKSDNNQKPKVINL
jgi:hypothetical protein